MTVLCLLTSLWAIVCAVSTAGITSTCDITPKELAGAWIKQTGKYQTVCAKESGANIAIIKLWESTFTYPSDCSFKCYLRCLYDKLGFLTLDGSINKANVFATMAGMNEPQAPEAYDTCIGPFFKCTDRCEMVWAFDHCLSVFANLTDVPINTSTC